MALKATAGVTKAPVLRRALFYVPASSQRMLSKSLLLRSDNVTYDLEDSVFGIGKRLLARSSALISRPPSMGELAIRNNAVSSQYFIDDIEAAAAVPVLDAVVVPKVSSPADLIQVEDALRHHAPTRHRSGSPNPIKTMALIESARAVVDLISICKSSRYLDGLVFAAEDFALDLSMRRTPSLTEFLYARSKLVTAARAFGLSSAIDLVCTSYAGPTGQQRLKEECENGSSMGFTGKQCIHLDQLQLVHGMFAPDHAEMEWAVRVVIAGDKASSSGRGAWCLDGVMIDQPVISKASVIVAKAEQCGLNIQDLRAKWKDQEPE